MHSSSPLVIATSDTSCASNTICNEQYIKKANHLSPPIISGIYSYGNISTSETKSFTDSSDDGIILLNYRNVIENSRISSQIYTDIAWKLVDICPYLSWDCPLHDSNILAMLGRIIISYIEYNLTFNLILNANSARNIRNICADVAPDGGFYALYEHSPSFIHYVKNYTVSEHTYCICKHSEADTMDISHIEKNMNNSFYYNRFYHRNIDMNHINRSIDGTIMCVGSSKSQLEKYKRFNDKQIDSEQTSDDSNVDDDDDDAIENDKFQAYIKPLMDKHPRFRYKRPQELYMNDYILSDIADDHWWKKGSVHTQQSMEQEMKLNRIEMKIGYKQDLKYVRYSMEHAAIIFPSNEVLFSIYKKYKQKLNDYSWLPILNLWRQSNSDKIYMIRGTKQGRIRTKAEKKRKRRRLQKKAEIEERRKRHRSYRYLNRKRDTSDNSLPLAQNHGRYKYASQLFEISINKHRVLCKNVFDFPSEFVSQHCSWYSSKYHCLLLVYNNRHSKSIDIKIVQSANVYNYDRYGLKAAYIKNHSRSLKIKNTVEKVGNKLKTKSRNYAKHRRKRRFNRRARCYSNGRIAFKNAQQKPPLKTKNAHRLKIENETSIIKLKCPSVVLSVFQRSKCHYLFHHKPSNSFVLMIRKCGQRIMLSQLGFDEQSMQEVMEHGRILVKLKISFAKLNVQHMSVGVIKIPEKNVKIVAYDDCKSCLILDTKKVSPISCYKTHVCQYAHQYRFMRLNDMVHKWKRIF